MWKVLLVFLGGGLGSLCRYGISLAMARYASTFPLATLLSNVLSSSILGFLVMYGTQHYLPVSLRLLIATGFCGGFSTFSTFAAESLTLLQHGQWIYGFTNMFGSMLLGLAGIYLGMRLSSLI